MRRLIFILVILLIVGSTSSSAFADGMVLRVRSDYTSLANEESQTAIIYYKGGIETLCLSVDINSERDDLFWVFPVPVTPDKAKIDIREMTRVSGGRDIFKAAMEVAEDARNFCLSTQLYPRLLFPGFFTNWEPTQSFKPASEPRHTPASTTDSVHVHQTVSKYGLTSELISADSITPLVEYLEISHDKLPDEATQALETYLDGGYSFVVTKAAFNSVGEGEIIPEHISPSVQVKFPTDRIFFPLKLTSCYGERVIPLELTVTDHITPKFPAEIRKLAESFYFIKSKVTPADFNKFTYLRVVAASYLYTDDLWMAPHPPLFVSFANLIRQNPSVLYYGQFIILSILCSIAAGLMAFPGRFTPKKLFQLTLLALSNFLTVLAVFVIAFGYAYYTGHSYRNAVKFTIIFSVLLVAITLEIPDLLNSVYSHYSHHKIV